MISLKRENYSERTYQWLLRIKGMWKLSLKAGSKEVVSWNEIIALYPDCAGNYMNIFSC